MDNAELLSKLKLLKIERRNGALFSSADECMQWIDSVLPLLKYDQHHYVAFYNHSQYVRITSLSADALMAHLNPMIGIVSQAIIELENSIELPSKIVSVHNLAAPPSTDKSKNAHDWHEMPPGKIAISVIAGVIVALIVSFIINPFALSLNAVSTKAGNGSASSVNQAGGVTAGIINGNVTVNTAPTEPPLKPLKTESSLTDSLSTNENLVSELRKQIAQDEAKMKELKSKKNFGISSRKFNPDEKQEILRKSDADIRNEQALQALEDQINKNRIELIGALKK